MALEFAQGLLSSRVNNMVSHANSSTHTFLVSCPSGNLTIPDELRERKPGYDLDLYKATTGRHVAGYDPGGIRSATLQLSAVSLGAAVSACVAGHWCCTLALACCSVLHCARRGQPRKSILKLDPMVLM